MILYKHNQNLQLGRMRSAGSTWPFRPVTRLVAKKCKLETPVSSSSCYHMQQREALFTVNSKCGFSGLTRAFNLDDELQSFVTVSSEPLHTMVNHA